MNLIERMRSRNGFTDSELNIIEYLLNNSGEKLTIAELSAATFCSNATIIRLCRKLGFDGYRSFYLEFIKLMESQKYQMEEVDYNMPFQEMESTHDIIYKMADHKFIISDKERDFSIATFYSQFAFEYICNILYASVYAFNYKEHKLHKDAIDTIRIR